MISIRPEEPREHENVHAINLAAFEGGPEADLVDTLRSSCSDHLSLVADEAFMVLVFDPAVLPDGRGVIGIGLLPSHSEGLYGFRLYDGDVFLGAYVVQRSPFLSALEELGVPMDDPAFQE